ncbi:Transcriptional regulatory protein CpxR [Nymphon striatum]|nr:Transcriptional regulatory protein CpxR [Nymphon striatum]
MQLVLEYFEDSGKFTDLHTYSKRGLPRPKDDEKIADGPVSDPVYAIWGTCSSLLQCIALFIALKKSRCVLIKLLMSDKSYDDTELTGMLSEYLESETFSVDQENDGLAGLNQARKKDYDAIVLDVMMPEMDGFTVLRELRQTQTTPVIMLTAKGEDIDRIVGLEMGADDYLPKPCNPRELVARLKAVLRRTQFAPQEQEEIKTGDLEVQPKSRKAYFKTVPLPLTSSEYNLLEALARQVGQVVDKETLSEQALGKKLTAYDRSIDMHMSKLRQKLGDDNQDLIQTVRVILIGVGVSWGTAIYIKNSDATQQQDYRSRFIENRVESLRQILYYGGEEAAIEFLENKKLSSRRLNFFVVDGFGHDVLGRPFSVDTPDLREFESVESIDGLGILSKPIKKLQIAAKEFSQGKLDTRVANKMGGRRDEIADLGRDFDQMAAQLQSLITNQKQLLSDISHELRSPLARMHVALGLARKKTGADVETEMQRIRILRRNA